MLKKCHSGGTQNVNEAFNSLLWKRCPKTVFQARPNIKMAAAAVARHYNLGPIASLQHMESLQLQVGTTSIRVAQRKEQISEDSAATQATPTFKDQRQAKRWKTIKKIVRQESNEGVPYATGK